MSRDDDRDPPPSDSALARPSEPGEGGPQTYGPNDLVKSTEAARILGISVNRLRHWVERDLVPIDHIVQEPGYRHAHKMFRVKDLRRVRRREQRRTRAAKKRSAGPASVTGPASLSASVAPHTSGDEDGLVQAEVFQLLRDNVSVPDIVIRLQVPVARVQQIAREYRQAHRPPLDQATMEALNDALSIRGFERLEGSDPVMLYRVLQAVLSDRDDYRHRYHDAQQALTKAEAMAARVPELEQRLAEAERQRIEAREEAEACMKKVERQHYVVERACEAMRMRSPEEGQRFRSVVEAARAKVTAAAGTAGSSTTGHVMGGGCECGCAERSPSDDDEG